MAERKSCEILRAADWIVEGASYVTESLLSFTLGKIMFAGARDRTLSYCPFFIFQSRRAPPISPRVISQFTIPRIRYVNYSKCLFFYRFSPHDVAVRHFQRRFTTKETMKGASEIEWLRDRERRSGEKL